MLQYKPYFYKSHTQINVGPNYKNVLSAAGELMGDDLAVVFTFPLSVTTSSQLHFPLLHGGS